MHASLSAHRNTTVRAVGRPFVFIVAICRYLAYGSFLLEAMAKSIIVFQAHDILHNVDGHAHKMQVAVCF